MATVRLTWFHATAEGGSVFEDLDVTLPRERTDPEGHLIAASNYYASPSVQLAELPAGLPSALKTLTWVSTCRFSELMR